ncbi:MAG: IclR family transcriptional regulator [Acidimicrobiia bacterium]|nr:IclR family transcriptional regulator [Acidimicrobiia bacterium]
MTVASVSRAFQLLRAVPASDGTLSGLARSTGLPVATVARLMGTLEQSGAVLRTDKVYRIGPTVIELATNEPAAYDLLAVANGYLGVLAAETDETAGIVQAVGDDHVHLGQVATEHDVAVRDWTGERVAAHSGCIGFVMMAHWPAAEVDRYLAGELPAFSPNTVTDPDQIRDRLAEVRRIGWLWTTGEFAPDVTAVAAPVLDRSGFSVGALHVHGPAYRFPGEGRRRDTIGRSVQAAAWAISETIGWRAGATDERGADG